MSQPIARAGVVAAAILLTSLSPSAMAQSSAAKPFPVAVGKSFKDKPFAPQMVVLPPGTFLMGSPVAETDREQRNPKYAAWEHPQREVTFAAPPAIGKYHVTRGEFLAFVKATHRPTPPECVTVVDGKWIPQKGAWVGAVGFPQTDRHPAVCVTWQDAQDYADWLSSQTGHRYRLIHEDEWEYAARGGTTTARWWGDGRGPLCTMANGGDRLYSKLAVPSDKDVNRDCADGFAFTAPEGSFKPNPFGLYDMFGNAWQWMGDCFNAAYVTGGPAPDGKVCADRSIRGGSWHNPPVGMRAAVRFSLPATMRSSSVGFRVARDPDR